MSTVADRLWSRITAIIASQMTAASRLAEESASWEVAKETLKERLDGFNEFLKESAEKHPTHVPDDVWEQQRKLHADLMRAQESFELADRAKRRDEKLVREQERRLLDLCVETFGDPSKLNYAEAAAGKQLDGDAWQGVMLADVIGDMFAPHYVPLGVITVLQAKNALEGTAVKQAVTDEKLTKQQAEFLKAEVIRFLDSRAIEHKLGKAPRKVEIPDAAKPAPEGASVPASDPSAFDNGGEIDSKQWSQFQDYCGATALASSKPIDKLVKVGERHFVCVAVGPDYAVGAHAVPRKELEKPGKKLVMRTEPDQKEGAEQYAGVVTAGPRSVEYILGRTYRFTPPAE